MTTRSMSPQHLRSPLLTFGTKKLSTGANGQKEDALSFFCARCFDRAVMGLRPCGRCGPAPGRGAGPMFYSVDKDVTSQKKIAIGLSALLSMHSVYSKASPVFSPAGGT